MVHRTAKGPQPGWLSHRSHQDFDCHLLSGCREERSNRITNTRRASSVQARRLALGPSWGADQQATHVRKPRSAISGRLNASSHSFSIVASRNISKLAHPFLVVCSASIAQAALTVGLTWAFSGVVLLYIPPARTPVAWTRVARLFIINDCCLMISSLDDVCRFASAVPVVKDAL